MYSTARNIGGSYIWIAKKKLLTLGMTDMQQTLVLKKALRRQQRRRLGVLMSN